MNRVMRLSIVVCVAVAAIRVGAQSSDQKPLAFEVASVKPNRSVGAKVLNRFDFAGDRVEITNATVESMVRVAYGKAGPPLLALANHQIAGGPDWIRSERFDVSGKAIPDSSGQVSASAKLLMLRALLFTRFNLSIRIETREGSIYVLALARSDGKLGPQLQGTTTDCVTRSGPVNDPNRCSGQIGFLGNMRARGRTMADLTNMFSKFMDRPVIDRTGLSGAFDLDLDFNPDGTGLPTLPGVQRPASDKPSIFTAVQEQLGLKLESAKGPVDVLVIDHVERPTPD